jgi:7,8-dihydroneopterin aldolase/epimerase/oxygenase
LKEGSSHGSEQLGFGSRRDGFLAHSNAVEDQVQIEELEIFAHIGVPDEERAAPQRLTFHIAFWPIRQAGEIEDEISGAVNYASVCAATRQFVKASRGKLIETLAHALALHLLETFEIRRITIELRKYILPDVEFVSVTVTRERSEK